MSQVLDASMALAWLFKRTEPAEAALAERALRELPSSTAVVPAIWYAEVANAVLRGERNGLVQPSQTSFFLERMSQADIELDEESPRTRQASVLALARAYGLTAYDAAYLELTMRTGGILATFDRQLGEAARQAGGRVFGDPA